MKVIWLVISGLRVDHLGVYGNRWLQLEQFDRLADAGRVFTGARSACADGLITRMEWFTGLDARRFADPYETFKNYAGKLTLPAQMGGSGFRTALLTDNYPMLPVYEQLDAFDTLIFVPGQGGDKHLAENFANVVFEGGKKYREIITGSTRTHPPQDVERYFRNRAGDQSLGRPDARLFETAERFLDQLKPDDDWFILIDAFGLTPPWDSPADVTRFRRKEDFDALAWPIAGSVDPGVSSVRKNVNFLRRAYADACLYLDSLLAGLARRVMDYYEKETFRFVLMSDRGRLIGDDNILLEGPQLDHPALTQQVMIALGHDIEEHARTDEPVAPVDLFTTTVEKTGLKNPPTSDGKVLQDL